jgi:hypothetical protein
MPIQ